MSQLRKAFAGLNQIDFTGLRFRLIDASGQPVGRLAAQLAKVLQGKDKPIYDPSRDLGDICIVINAEKAVLTGRKWDRKTYTWHTGFPGGLKELPANELWRKDPTEVLMRAVEGMLPKNLLQDARLKKLRVFPGPDHPFTQLELVPWNMPPKNFEDRGLGWVMPEGFTPMNPEAFQRRQLGMRLHKLPAAARAPAADFRELLAPEERELVAAQQQQQQQQQQAGSSRRPEGDPGQ